MEADQDELDDVPVDSVVAVQIDEFVVKLELEDDQELLVPVALVE